MITLNNENYYSPQANKEYMSVSQFKNFAGSTVRKACENHALATLNDTWHDETTTALLVGSYVDSYFEGTLAEFKTQHPEIFKKDGNLKSDYVHAEKIIKRIESDPLFMEYLAGQKQVIMTGEILNIPFKIKMDSYIPDDKIVDLKVMSIFEEKYVPGPGWTDPITFWGYDIQGAVYQEIVRQNTGKLLPFYIAAATKEKEPDIEIIHIPNDVLAKALKFVTDNLPRIMDIKNNKILPIACGKCDCCKSGKKLVKPIELGEFISNCTKS